MNPTIRRLAILSSIVIFSACSVTPAPDDGASTSSEPQSPVSSSVPATENVNYTGTLDKVGISIYQQGTHKLTMADGRFILLTAADAALDLDAYVGRMVEVHGSVEPTVEAGGTIMRVTQVTILAVSSSSEISSSEPAKTMCGGFAGFPCPDGLVCVDDPSDSCDPQNGGADCGGMCVTPITSSSSVSSVSSVPSSSSSSKSSSKSSSSVASSVPPPPPPSSSSSSSLQSAPAALEAQIVQMAKLDYSKDSLWTQQYCTGHIGFCVPAQKNWYFQSFGAKTSTLWHVEFGMGEISAVGGGPLSLDVVVGTAASGGKPDGQIETQGSQVVGYKEWAGGRHIEIKADARLKAAVAYMLEHISTYASN